MTCGLFNYLFHVQSTPKKSLCVSILQIRPINTKEICFPEVVSWDPHPELWGPKTCLLFFPSSNSSHCGHCSVGGDWPGRMVAPVAAGPSSPGLRMS